MGTNRQRDRDLHRGVIESALNPMSDQSDQRSDEDTSKVRLKSPSKLPNISRRFAE